MKKIIPTHTAASVIPQVITCPVTFIRGIWKLRICSKATTLTRALPDHLVHYIIKGQFTVVINGRNYFVKAGDIIHYYGTEEVAAINGGEEVEFYSISFEAPSLKAPKEMNRIIKGNEEIYNTFKDIHDLSSENHLASSVSIYANFFKILEFISRELNNLQPITDSPLWYKIEAKIRDSRDFRVSIPELSGQENISSSTLYRICIKETGMSPSKRLQQLRMEEAKGLLLFTDLSITNIALELGYPRLQEFSREFKKYFGKSPKALRTGQ